MIGKRFQTIDQWQVAELEEVRGFTKIAVDQFLHAQVVMTMPLLYVTQKAWETARLKSFQLFLHRFHVRSQCQFAAIVEDQMIGWVHALKFQKFIDRRSRA